jgi:nucleoside-diphosphate-sugar epimerase
LEAVKNTPTVARLIVTSTQFVHKSGHLPENDQDFDPYTVYGQSKVITEKLTRSARLDCIWTIVRPTVIWGPWHPQYPNGVWRLIKRRLYYHPGKAPVIRSYGYVGTVAFQLERILHAPSALVNHRVYYLGDLPMNQLDWVNAFSLALTGKPVRVIPRELLHVMAFIGDALSSFGVRFPMYTARFRRMTDDYLIPMEPTIEALGESPYSLQRGVQQTVQWLQCHGYV